MGNSRGIKHFSHATIMRSQSLHQQYKLTNFCKHRVKIHVSLSLRQGNVPPRFSRHIHHGAVVAIATSRATADKLTMKPPWKRYYQGSCIPGVSCRRGNKTIFWSQKPPISGSSTHAARYRKFAAQNVEVVVEESTSLGLRGSKFQ